MSKIFVTISFIILYWNNLSLEQRTELDRNYESWLRPLRKLSYDLVGRTGEDATTRKLNDKLGKTQDRDKTRKFPCDTKNGRNSTRPASVHKLRPGDIDVIGAIGDSLTAANGAMALNVLQVLVENRGISWVIGGQSNWRRFLTLPNILKEFNSNLYGYSLHDGFSFEKSSRLNVAEAGAMSRDIVHQAGNLIKRIKSDPNINMKEDWKLVTIFIGNNDFCSDICYPENQGDDERKSIKRHEKDLLTALRMLRDNIPRLMVNIVPPPNLSILTRFRGLPSHCYFTHLALCPCLIGIGPSRFLNSRSKLMNEWIDLDKEIANRDEFNREDFTVNYQPFTRQIIFPQTKNLSTDVTFLSLDCFHLSQKSHARSANAIWNNMLERDGEKEENWHEEFSVFKCPTEERPYLATRVNSL